MDNIYILEYLEIDDEEKPVRPVLYIKKKKKKNYIKKSI